MAASLVSENLGHLPRQTKSNAKKEMFLPIGEVGVANLLGINKQVMRNDTHLVFSNPYTEQSNI